ncbi:MAG: NlpB/DapX lipoprotein [Gammaproteobacteria bacterium]|jgi:uncharacterized lipoprotein|nr:NlpB/DapX lipoprotein [Gammaproteobacteria bacterium]
MKKIIGFSLIASSILVLSGCAHAFRNRAYDYANQDVNQLPPLQVPAGVTSPKFQPALNVPPGPMNYPASGMPVMTPPFYSDSYQINDKAKQATLMNSAPPAVAQVKPVPTKAVANQPISVSQQAAAPLHLPSQIVRSAKNIPILEVTAPFSMTWNQMAVALQKSGFRIVNVEQQNGYYFIVPQGDNNDADAVLLYLKQNQNLTQVILYTGAGNPDGSSNANLTLQQLAKNL